jgi:hypothetical protein
LELDVIASHDRDAKTFREHLLNLGSNFSLMPRQSTSRRDRADDLDFIVPDDEIESDHIPPPEPSTKRRKTDTSAVSTSRQAPKKTRRGNLKQLAQMPWDILLEVAQFSRSDSWL